MTDTVLTYKGRPITDLTKNELADAMTWAFQEIEYQRERADRFLNAAALAEPKPPVAEPLAQKAYVAFVEICKGGSDDAGTYDADEALVRRALRRLHELEGCQRQ